MAGTTVGELNVRLNLELQRLDAQISQANAKMAKMSKGWNVDIAKAARTINGTLATIGVGASMSGLIAFGKQCLDLGGQIVDLSYQAGIGTDAFQNFRAAAMDSGASGEQVADMFAKMRKSVQDAVEGNKTLGEAFTKLNLSAGELKKLAPETQFELVARAVSGAKDKQEAYNAAADIFGAKIAPKMMQFIDAIANGGIEKAAEGIAKVRLSPEQLKTLDDAGDKLARIWDKIRLIGAHGIVGIVDAASVDDLAQIEARIKMLKELRDQGNVTYTINGDTADVNQALKNFEALRDRKIGKKTEEKVVDIKAEQERQAAAVEAAKLEQLNAEVIKATADAEALATAATKERTAQDEKYFEAMRRKDQELNAVAESTLRLIDPSRQYNQQIEKINEALHENKLKADEAAAAVAKLKAESVDASLNDFFGDLDEKSAENMRAIEEKTQKADEAARQLGMTFSSAFEDAIVEGKKFSDVLSGIAQDILRLFIRKQITEPIAASLSSAFSSAGSSGVGGAIVGGIGKIFGFASGGEPPVGRASIVGEAGPELFVPKVAGTIIPNHALAGDGGDGGAITIIQNFQAGVSQSQLTEGLRQTYEAAKSGVMDAIQRRRGGFGAISA